MNTMPKDDEGVPEKGSQKKDLHCRTTAKNSVSVNNKGMDVKNKNKEMYWGNGKNVPSAHSAPSVPTVSHSPTLHDIPEESEEYSEDDGAGASSTNSWSHNNAYSKIKHRPVVSTHVVFESNLSAQDTSSTSLYKPQSKADNTEESQRSIDILDKEFTDMLFLQFHILKKSLLETKEQKQGIEDKLDFSQKENETLKEKIINFQKQEEVMIADRRDICTQLVLAREKVIQSQLEHRSFKVNSDLQQQSEKLQEENKTLKREKELRKSKLESCQNTIKKMIEENSSLKKSEQILKTKGEEAEKEINRLAIELAVWKQKAKKIENSSAASSFISDQQINNDSKLLSDKKLKSTTSYVEIISSTPSPTTKATVHYETVDKNKAITVIKEAKDSNETWSNSSQIKLINRNESVKSVQQPNKGIESLLVPEAKDSVMSRTEANKTLSDRLTALEKKIQLIQPMMDLVESLKTSQDRMGKELDQRLSQSISIVTSQIISLRNVFEKVQLQLSASPSPNKSISNIGAQNLENVNKGVSKSNIPVSINRKSW